MPRRPKQIAISVLLLLAVTLIVVTVRTRGAIGMPPVGRPKPLRPSEIVVERSYPPSDTLAERLATVDAVARVRVLGQPRVRAVDTTEWLRRRIPGLNRTIRAACPVTEWTLEVVEALKPRANAQTGATLKLGAVGGRAVFDDQELLVDPPAFELLPGQSYLISLIFQEPFGMFVSTEFDVFNVSGPQARAAGTRTLETPYASSWLGKPLRA